MSKLKIIDESLPAKDLKGLMTLSTIVLFIYVEVYV